MPAITAATEVCPDEADINAVNPQYDSPIGTILLVHHFCSASQDTVSAPSFRSCENGSHAPSESNLPRTSCATRICPKLVKYRAVSGTASKLPFRPYGVRRRNVTASLSAPVSGSCTSVANPTPSLITTRVV